MSTREDLLQYADQVGSDIAAIITALGDLDALSTVQKSNLVGAINEAVANTPTGVLLSASNLGDILDAAAARVNLGVRSAAEISSEISTAVSSAIANVTLSALGGLTEADVDVRIQTILGTAPAALDTLTEIAISLGNDPNFAGTMTTALGDRVSYSVQNRTVAQRLQACINLGIGNPEADYLARYIAARDAAAI